jgi:hypothetical protein
MVDEMGTRDGKGRATAWAYILGVSALALHRALRAHGRTGADSAELLKGEDERGWGGVTLGRDAASSGVA